MNTMKTQEKFNLLAEEDEQRETEEEKPCCYRMGPALLDTIVGRQTIRYCKSSRLGYNFLLDLPDPAGRCALPPPRRIRPKAGNCRKKEEDAFRKDTRH